MGQKLATNWALTPLSESSPQNSGSPHLFVTRLRGYAVTHIVLYVQLYPHNRPYFTTFTTPGWTGC